MVFNFFFVIASGADNDTVTFVKELFAVIVGIVLLIYQGTSDPTKPLTYGDILDHFYNEDVATYTIDYNKKTLTIQLFERDAAGNLLDEDGDFVTPNPYTGEYPSDVKYKLSAKQTYKLADVNATRIELLRITEQQEAEGVGVGILSTYENTPANVMPWWVSLIPWVLIIIVFILLYSFKSTETCLSTVVSINMF